MKILIASKIYADSIEKLKENHEVICAFGADKETLKSAIQGWDILIFRSGVDISAEVMAASSNLKDRAHGICQVENNAPTSNNASSGISKPAVQDPESDAQVRAGSGQFDATGNIPCAQHKGQPMGQCQMGVARAGNGSATVVVTKPDGVKRAIFFSKGKAISADTSQADGYPEFRATREFLLTPDSPGIEFVLRRFELQLAGALQMQLKREELNPVLAES